MKNSKITFLLSLFIVMLLPITSCFYLAINSISENDIGNSFSSKGSINFSEDFTNTSYMDSVATNANGWGSGVITKARDYQIMLLDYLQTNYPVRGLDVQGRKARRGRKPAGACDT